jgi:hypothetical protein
MEQWSPMPNSIRTGGLILAAALLASSCEPSSLTEARDQLGRGGERIVEYVLPVVSDTFNVESLLDPAVVFVTSDSMLGIRIDTRTLGYGIGLFAPFIGLGDSVPVVAYQEIVSDQASNKVDFGDLEDVVRQVTLHDARLLLSVENTADVDAILVDFNLGVAELTAGGLLPSPIVFETDSVTGDSIFVAVAETNQNYLTIPANGDTTFTFQGGALIDRLVHMVLDGRRAALVGEGTVTTDAVAGQILGSDAINLQLDLITVLDFTVPDTGVVFVINTTQDGLDFDADDADPILERLVLAELATDVINDLPFGMELDIAFAPGDLGDEDLFSNPDAVIVTRVGVDTAIVDLNGRLIDARTSTALISLLSDQVRALLDNQFTASVRVRLMGNETSQRRGAVSAGARALFDSRGRIQLRLGASQ